MILQNFSKKDRFPLPVPGRAGCEKEYFMKKILSLLLAFSLALSLAACGGSASSAASSAAVSEVASSAAASEEEETAAPLSATEPLRIAGLKGPTTMGLVNLLSMEQAGTAAMDYDLQLYGAADEIVPLLIKGELDMAAIPANLAATLYQKTSGGIQAVAVNTLGVLYVVEQGDTVHSMADLKGRTILSTGKGTTPEYVLRYLLTANGLDPDKDVDIQYYSEATEVTAQMASTQDAIAVLPQPYVTAAGLKDDTLRVALDLTVEWDKVADTQLITGVTVVRKAYAEEHPDANAFQVPMVASCHVVRYWMGFGQWIRYRSRYRRPSRESVMSNASSTCGHSRILCPT